MAEPVTVMHRPLRAALAGLMWLGLAAAGALVAAAGFRALGPSENGFGVVLMVTGALALAAGALRAWIAFTAARITGPVLTFTAEGFTDHRLSAQAVPWRALSWSLVFNGSGYGVHFGLTPEAAAGYRVSAGHRVLAAANRLFRYPPFAVHASGTGLSVRQLAEIMGRFKASGIVP